MTALAAFTRMTESPAADIVESMPQRLYAALPYPSKTAEFCVDAVDAAMRTRNPRRILDWLDYEMATPVNENLLECLDLTIRRVVGFRAGQERTVFSSMIVKEARAHVRGASQAIRRSVANRNAEPIVAGILVAISAYDESLAKHSLAVETLARRMADFAGLDEETIARISLAARVHEIGKLSVTSDLRSKRARFDDHALATVRAQIRAGSDVLNAHEPMRHIVHIVRACYDDVSSEMPTESRVIAVADAFHTLTMSRPYRKAVGPREALTEVLRLRGQRFDPAFADALAGMLASPHTFAQSA